MNTADLNEEEIQTLIVAIELGDPIETPNNNHYSYSFYPKTADEAKRYFCGYSVVASNEVTKDLQSKGLLNKHSQLTLKGKEVAKDIRIHRPPIYYWYRKYYSAIENSKAFANFNRDVYGIDIDQLCFSGTQQVKLLAELLELDETTICLYRQC